MHACVVFVFVASAESREDIFVREIAHVRPSSASEVYSHFAQISFSAESCLTAEFELNENKNFGSFQSD